MEKFDDYLEPYDNDTDRELWLFEWMAQRPHPPGFDEALKRVIAILEGGKNGRKSIGNNGKSKALAKKKSNNC